MSGVWGDRLKITVFGESHGPAVGVVIDGLPPGFRPDWDGVRADMARRAPGGGPLVTPRREDDEWRVLSGVFEGAATGTPLCAVIDNTNTKSEGYDRHVMRPGHADYTSFVKYGGYADYRGGGHASGRLTAPLVFAGSLARQVLRADGVEIGARIASIRGIEDASAGYGEIIEASRKPMPVCSDAAGERMARAIAETRDGGDSVGGVIECVATGVPPGWGSPFFRSIESAASELLFSVPAVKGVEFGDGFALAGMLGSQANDGMYMDGGAVRHRSNHSGGISGGITNGEPIVMRAAIRPTPTIAREQTTVDIKAAETVRHSFTGRHDPCVVLRAVPVVEAALALCLLNFSLERRVY
ncbi:MAG: chorismate synthase [Oscillospiraceae bacterium]|jgi:chorismate synthase|nr:chorismate synthase [Oscillospiraceae bacterium]